jgi:hypothetical protein
MKNKIFIRILALFLIAVITLPLLSACSVRKVPAGKLALTSVGTVDGKEVLYEELFYLTANYLPALKEKYGDDTEVLKSELRNTVYENIVTNYGILSLCEDAGVSIDENILKDNIQNKIDTLVDKECGGSRSNYKDMLKEVNMTDHYMRETMRVECLYSELPAKYASNGLVPANEDEILDYVAENFVRTKHIAILVENGESYEEELKKAQDALAAYEREEYAFYQLIGSKYNEDLSPQTSDDGYYSAKGTMDEAYENAAFSLEINGVSGIVESTGVSNITGNTVPCFYIIQRLEIENDYVTKNLSDIQDKCANAIIAQKLDEKKASLEFKPNDFGASLDLTSLEYPKDAFDFFIFFIAFACTIAIGGVALIIVFIVIRRKKRIEKRRSKKSLK